MTHFCGKGKYLSSKPGAGLGGGPRVDAAAHPGLLIGPWDRETIVNSVEHLPGSGRILTQRPKYEPTSAVMVRV